MKMKYVFFAIICLLPALHVRGQVKLEVTVKNIREAKGSIRVGLFASEENFLKTVAYAKVTKAQEKEVTVIFEGLQPGAYALSVIHDANENGELDSNLFGMPKEGFAFGNNAMGTFGPPSFEKARVTLGADGNKQIIDLKYL
jgi:uncharacterized protein (DUF2141 family)